MTRHYNKPALTFAQQLQRLKDRGLAVADDAAAKDALAAISYYRLSAYWYPLRQTNEQGERLNRFVDGASFEEAIRLYEFDRHLRMLVLDAIERIEVALRTRITYQLGHQYGAFAHLDARHFHPKFRHAQWLERVRERTGKASDAFITHYKAHYSGFPDLPIWMLTEVMSFGALQHLYKGLLNNRQQGVEDKKAIAAHFNIHHKRLQDWLVTLNYVRNICAHHSRLWNKELVIRPDKSKLANWNPPVTPRNDRVFYILLMLRHLLAAIHRGDAWAEQVTQLIAPIAQTTRYRLAMGLPDYWQRHPLWQVKSGIKS